MTSSDRPGTPIQKCEFDVLHFAHERVRGRLQAIADDAAAACNDLQKQYDDLENQRYSGSESEQRVVAEKISQVREQIWSLQGLASQHRNDSVAWRALVRRTFFVQLSEMVADGWEVAGFSANTPIAGYETASSEGYWVLLRREQT